MIPKKLRLPPEDIRELIRVPAKPIKRGGIGFGIILKTKNNSLTHNRYAVLIGRKVEKKASRRNFWRRRIAEEFRRLPNRGKDILAIVSLKTENLSFAEAKQTITEHLASAIS